MRHVADTSLKHPRQCPTIVDMSHIAKPVADMDASVKPDTGVPDAADAVDALLGTEDWSTLLPPEDNRA